MGVLSWAWENSANRVRWRAQAFLPVFSTAVAIAQKCRSVLPEQAFIYTASVEAVKLFRERRLAKSIWECLIDWVGHFVDANPPGDGNSTPPSSEIKFPDILFVLYVNTNKCIVNPGLKTKLARPAYAQTVPT